MKHRPSIIMLGLILFVSSAAMAAFESKVEFVTDAQEYQAVMHRLLARNWKLDKGPLRVWSKADPKAQAREDYSELQKKPVSNVAALLPEEIGITPGNAHGPIYAGPYVTGAGRNRSYFIVTVDDRPYGYDQDRYYIISQKAESLKGTLPNSVESITHSRANRIKEVAWFPLPSGFQVLSDKGRQALTRISNQKWSRSVTFDIQSPFFARLDRLTWTHDFSFQFWNDFKNIDYSVRVVEPSGERSIGPFQTMPEVFTIGERQVSAGVWEFALFAGNQWALFQADNHAGFLGANADFFNAQNGQEADALLKRSELANYCYSGYDCSVADAYWTRDYKPGASFKADAALWVFRIDESKPRRLQVRVELTDPRHEGKVSEFEAR